MTSISTDKVYRRTLTLEAISAAQDSDTITLSFSSEYPFDRGGYIEVLDHSPGAVDLSRVETGACPLLFNHNENAPIGQVLEAHIATASRKGYATVKFSSTSSLAQQLQQQVQDGSLTNVSCQYRIHEYDDSQLPLVRVTRWELLEISLVSIPVDPTVGVGRSTSFQSTKVPQRMEDTILQERSDERSRVKNISAMARHYGTKVGQAQADEIAERAIDSGISEVEARAMYADALMAVQNPEASQPITAPAPVLGLTQKEQRAYSLTKAIQAQLTNDWSQAGFELECSRAIAKGAGRAAQGFYMPIRDLVVDGVAASAARAYNKTTVGQGGNLIETSLDSQNFIELLRNRPRLMQAGAKLISGLVGDVAVPRRSSAATAYWIAEGVDTTESTGAFDLVTLRPKQLAAYNTITKLMLAQATPDIEMLVRDDLVTVIALEMDRAGIDGTGSSGQPRGILNTVGVGSVAMGTNGAAITYDAIVDAETAVATANADEANLGYMTNAKVVGALKKLKASGTGEYLWVGTDAGLYQGTPGALNGYPVYRTNQMPANKTKGTGTNLSTLIFGDFSQAMFGEWGVLDILVDPYTGIKSGAVGIRGIYLVDFQVRHPESFAIINDIVA